MKTHLEISVWREFTYMKRKFCESYTFIDKDNKLELKIFILTSHQPVLTHVTNKWYDQHNVYEGCGKGCFAKPKKGSHDWRHDWAKDINNVPHQARWSKLKDVDIPDEIIITAHRKLYTVMP